MTFKDLEIGTQFTLKHDDSTWTKVNDAVGITEDEYEKCFASDYEVFIDTSFTVILFSPDGVDFVRDFRESKSIDACWESISNMGSRWIFYPLPFILGDQTKTIVGAIDDFRYTEGMTISELKEELQREDTQSWVSTILS